MKKWTLLEQTKSPDGGVMALFEHDGAYTIRIDGKELMSTRKHFSEEELANATCSRLLTKRAARVLIGGLGFGFTLRAALAHLAPDAKVVVAELMKEVVEWNQNPVYALAGDTLKDPRVQLVVADVSTILRRERASYDAILLDVDNGPSAFSAKNNDHLYGRSGLFETLAALRPGGQVGYWSAFENPVFATAMKEAGFKVELKKVRAHVTSGSWHSLYIGSLQVTP